MSRLKHCLLLTLAISTFAPPQMAQARDWLGPVINTVTRVRQAAGALGGNSGGGNYGGGGGANYAPPPIQTQTNVSGTVVPPSPPPAPTPAPTPVPTPSPPTTGGLVGSGYNTSSYYHSSRHPYSTGARQDQNQYAVVQLNRPQPRNVFLAQLVLTNG